MYCERDKKLFAGKDCICNFCLGRHRLSYLSAAGSTCSSDGMESLNFADLDLSADGLDKLHGTMEHFMSKVYGAPFVF